MKNEAEIIVKLRAAAKVGDQLLPALEELSQTMAANPDLPHTAELIRRTREYIDMLEMNARMAEAFQNIMSMAMEVGMFEAPPRNSTKH
jgi:uncharacterized membrane-anchored protein YjiN (DUF445 family)